MANLRGVDVASYQGTPDHWSQQAGHVAWIAVKITELQPNGVKYVNPDAAADWKYAAQHKLGRIGYLFGHPATDPHVTVEFFIAELEKLGLADDDGVMVDMEVADGHSPAQIAAWTAIVLVALEKRLGRRPIVYTDLSFGEINLKGCGKYPLWIADPDRPAGNPRIPSHWKTWAIHQYATRPIDRDVANYGSLAAMAHELGKPAVLVEYVTNGKESLVRVAKTHGVLASTILRKTAIHDGVYEDELAHYLNQGNLNAKMPKGIKLLVPARNVAVKKRAVKAAAAKSATATKDVVKTEPVMTAAGVLAVAAPLVSAIGGHIAVTAKAVTTAKFVTLAATVAQTPLWSATTQAAILTILTGLAGAYAAIRTKPIKVTVLAGALSTIATASAAFGLHVSPTWIGGEMPVVALVAGLLLRMHVSPRVKTVVTDVEQVAEEFTADLAVPAPTPDPAPVAEPSPAPPAAVAAPITATTRSATPPTVVPPSQQSNDA